MADYTEWTLRGHWQRSGTGSTDTAATASSDDHRQGDADRGAHAARGDGPVVAPTANVSSATGRRRTRRAVVFDSDLQRGNRCTSRSRESLPGSEGESRTKGESTVGRNALPMGTPTVSQRLDPERRHVVSRSRSSSAHGAA